MIGDRPVDEGGYSRIEGFGSLISGGTAWSGRIEVLFRPVIIKPDPLPMWGMYAPDILTHYSVQVIADGNLYEVLEPLTLSLTTNPQPGEQAHAVHMPWMQWDDQFREFRTTSNDENGTHITVLALGVRPEA